VTLELVQALRQAILPISVQLPASSGDAVTVPSDARLHLGPLLLAGGEADGSRGSKDTADGGQAAAAESAAPRWQRPARPSEVRATLTESIGVAGLYELDVRVTTDIPVLSPEMLRRVMPFCFTLEAVQSLPNEPWLPDRCEDTYLHISPQVSKTTACLVGAFPPVRSGSRPHNSTVRFSEPVVWLLGFSPPHKIREWLQHEGLVVEVHDRDLRPPEVEEDAEGEASADGGSAAAAAAEEETAEDKAAKAERERNSGKRVPHPHGVARFTLGSLLESQSLEVRMRADVFPGRSDKKQRRAEELSEGLRAAGLLEEEGMQKVAQRGGLDKREDTTDYHEFGTVCTIRAALAVPFPKARDIRQQDEVTCRETWSASEQRHGEEGSSIFQAVAPEEGGTVAGSCAPVEDGPHALPFRAKVALEDGAEIAGPWRRQRQDAETDQQRLQAAADAQIGAEDPEAAAAAVQAVADELAGEERKGLDCRFERFGRFVVVVDESNLDFISAVLRKVMEWNADVKKIDPSSAELSTYQLTDAEKQDPHFDILTGVALLDGKSRIFVLEGLRDQGLKAMLEHIKAGKRANDSEFKLLNNPEIGYSRRLYADFGSLKLKQIKIRMPLEDLAAKPDLYSVSGSMSDATASGIQAIKQLMGLKQMSRLRALRHGSAFPEASNLLDLEILYGGFITDAELEGRAESRRSPGRSRSRRSIAAAAAAAAAEETSAAESVVAEPNVVTLRPQEILQARTMKKSKRKTDLNQDNTVYDQKLRLRESSSVPDFRQVNKTMVKQQSEDLVKLNESLGKVRIRDTSFLEGQQVYIYSGQKLQSSELHKDHMRKHMDPEQAKQSWTYNPDYLTSTFEFTGAQPPGLNTHQDKCPADSYANVEGDDRPKWRPQHARPKEEFRKPGRDLHPSRGEDLQEGFVDNEWQSLPMGVERRKPVAVHVRYEPDKVPHRRVISERPFDASRMQPGPRNFGPTSDQESVHYHGRLPGENRYAEAERHSIREKDRANSKIIDERRHGQHMRIFGKDATRRGITDLDRNELLLKDKPSFRLRGKLDHTMPHTIRNLEEYHETGQPAKEWQARLRENDGSPPYEVHTGTYLPRDPEVTQGMKRAVSSGTLGKAPWQHKAASFEATKTLGNYQSAKDFNLTRPPAQKKVSESHVCKNASRSTIQADERRHLAYQRPADYGIRLLS